MKIEELPQVGKGVLVSLQFNSGVVWFDFLWSFLIGWGFVFLLSCVFLAAVNYVLPTRNRKKQEKMQISQCWASHMNEIKKLMLSQHCSSVEVVWESCWWDMKGCYCHF